MGVVVRLDVGEELDLGIVLVDESNLPTINSNLRMFMPNWLTIEPDILTFHSMELTIELAESNMRWSSSVLSGEWAAESGGVE
jgi:hypothetical protein